MKREKQPIKLLYLGQWIEWVNEAYSGSLKFRLGRIIEIKANGILVVRSQDCDFQIYPDSVVKAYPFFTVLPIPGKLEEKEY